MWRMLDTKCFHDVMQLTVLPTDQNVALTRVVSNNIGDCFTVVAIAASVDVYSESLG